MTVTLDHIRAAADRIRDGIYLSPCPPSEPLSLAADCQVYCKREYLQRTGSFKERGARNAMMLLDDDAKQRGVVAASAGNHALGLAYHGKLLNIPVTVVMPRFAPLTKIANCRQFGANVIIHGDDFGQAVQHARTLGTERQLTYVHGFDDPAVIAGQGTMGLEILEQVPDVDAIVVPVGGAGLIAGIGLAVKAIKPNVRIIGVEPKRAACFTAALEAGKPVTVETSPTLADGLAVPRIGDNAFAIAREVVDQVVVVGERDIALAVLRLVELEKAVVEGAGAAGLAACLAGLLPDLQGKRVVLPLCGGNLDTPMLGRIIERGLAVDGRLCRFDAVISDRPGGLARFSGIIADTGASIRDIFHDRAFAGEDLAAVRVRCVVETRDTDHVASLRKNLADAGFILE